MRHAFPLSHEWEQAVDAFDGKFHHGGNNVFRGIDAVKIPPFLDHIQHPRHVVTGFHAQRAGADMVAKKVAQPVLNRSLGIGVKGHTAGKIELSDGVGQGARALLQEIGDPDLADPVERFHTGHDQLTVGDKQFFFSRFHALNQAHRFGAGLRPVRGIFGGRGRVLFDANAAPVDFGEEGVNVFGTEDVHHAALGQKAGDRLRLAVGTTVTSVLPDAGRVVVRVLESGQADFLEGKAGGGGEDVLAVLVERVAHGDGVLGKLGLRSKKDSAQSVKTGKGERARSWRRAGGTCSRNRSVPGSAPRRP